MKPKQILEAIDRMKVFLEHRINQGEYDVISARKVLWILGYDLVDTQIVLENIADGGFSYCLDRNIKCSNGDPNNPGEEYPAYSVCYWSPDQLKSRLDSLHW